jgi:hypothetical protein
MYNNNAVSQPLSLQGHIRPSEIRRTRIPIIQHRCRGRRGDRVRRIHHSALIQSLVLEISRRAVYHRDNIPPRILCSHNGR